MKKNIIFLDKVGDYSLLHRINRTSLIDTDLLLLASYLEKMDFNPIYNNFRDKNFSKSNLVNEFDELAPSALVVNVTSDNIKQLERLGLFNDFQYISKILFADGINLKNTRFIREGTLILKKTKDNNIENTFKEEIVPFLKKTNLVPESNGYTMINLKTSMVKWDIVQNIKKYTPEINIGWGCQRSCSFCASSNTETGYRDLDIVFNEIQFLLDNSCHYFHIKNHNFTSNFSFMKAFCEGLIKNFANYDYTWSCFGLPEELIKHDQALEILASANLGRIELSIESGSTKMIDNYKIKSTNKIVKSVIEKAYKSGITSIAGNMIIGGPFENDTTITKSKKLMQDLISIAPGSIEFQFSFYDPDLNSDIYTEKHDLEIDTNSMKRGYRRINSIYRTSCFTCGELEKIKKEMIKGNLSLMKESVLRMNQLARFKHIDFFYKGLCTQYYFFFLSKSSTAVLYKYKYKNNFVKFSWECIEETDSWCPYLLGRILQYNDHTVIFIDPIYTSENQKPYIEIDPEFKEFLELANGKYTIAEIIENIQSNKNTKDINYYYHNLQELEEHDLLSFIKIFR